jgi:hypothetical protein
MAISGLKGTGNLGRRFGVIQELGHKSLSIIHVTWFRSESTQVRSAFLTGSSSLPGIQL